LLAIIVEGVEDEEAVADVAEKDVVDVVVDVVFEMGVVVSLDCSQSRLLG
jgi:hypothetical protein